MRMAMRVAHIAALVDQDVIEHGAIPVRHILEFFHENREVLHMIAVHLCVIGDVLRLVAMMRGSMPTAIKSRFREAGAGQITTEHERCGTSNVSLESQCQQVVHQFEMLKFALMDAEW